MTQFLEALHLPLNFDVVRPGEAGLVDDRMTEELLEPVSENQRSSSRSG
jgi:hypothetical protein